MALDSLILDSLIQDGRVIRDGGPVYCETNLEHFIAEPLNGASALLFIPIALYWLVYSLKRRKTHGLLIAASLILLVGGIGGTVYHFFRLSPIFLQMDWMPIMILTLMASFYFFYKATGRWWWGLVAFFVSFGVSGLLFTFIDPSIAVSINYVTMAIYVLLPLYLLMRKLNYLGLRWVLIAVFSFVVAISFRIVDDALWMPFCSHFLWHLFGASASLSMFVYLNVLISTNTAELSLEE